MKDLVEKLLNRGADVNTKMAQNDGQAPSFSLLHTIAAARLENVELAKTVLDFGCSINEKTLDGETALMKASKPKPFINLAKLFIESGADVNLADKQGFTPLLNVVYSKDPNLELIELLIKSGRCDLEMVTCQDHHGCAAIHYAIIYRNLEIAKLLIENRCDVNIRTSCLPNSTTPNKATPLVLAIQKFTGDELAEIVKVLLKNEADTMLTYEASGSELFGLRTTEHLELTPLHTAALNDNMINVMRMLIKHGADVNAASPTGCPITPLSVAIRKGNLNAAELLIKKGATVTPVFDETFSSYQGLDRYPFNLAVEFGRRDLLDLLADFGAKIFKPAQIDANIGRDKEPLTPLALACSNNSADGLVQQVIRIGADVRDNSPKDTPPLHIAVLDLSEPRCDAAVKTLLQYGADADISVDYRSSKRISVLNQATESGFANTARLLMQAGADILRPHYDSELGTNVVPAFNVSRRGETFQDTLLFNHGTDINHCGYRSVNILHYVVGTTDDEVLELLLKYGVDAEELGGIAGTDTQPEGSLMKPLQMMIFNDLSNEETAKILLRYSTAVNWRCTVGNKRYSTLMLCVSENDDETARLLVRYGADVNYQERKSGESSLLMAVRDGDSDCFKVLMEAACDVDLPSDLGITPLIQATMIGQVEMVRRLIGASCDVNATCTSGEPDADDNRDNEEGEQFCHDSTALHQAVELGFTKIVKMLLEAGALTEAKENHKGSPGFTPLHCATVTSHKEIVEILLDAKCKINAQTDEGLTALHLSVKEDDMPMAKMLFERGANPMIKTKEGKLASELSQRMHFTQELLGYEMKWTFLHQRPTLQRKRLSLHQRLSMQNLGLFRMNALNVPVAEAAGGELPAASQRTERAVQGVSQ